MDETESTSAHNPLRIVEDETENENETCDKSDNDSNGELFDFSASDIEELESDSGKRRSLLIIEEKDLTMDDNNNNNNLHRLSLQVESGDDNSLVMTNEAINRTIIRIGSNGSSVDFGEADGNLIEKPHEAINQEMTAAASQDDDGGEAIVSLLGQINDIVGLFVNLFMSARGKIVNVGDGVALSVSVIAFPNLTFECYRPKFFTLMIHKLDFSFFFVCVCRQKHDWQQSDKREPKRVKFACENWIDNRRSWNRMRIAFTTCSNRRFYRRQGRV